MRFSNIGLALAAVVASAWASAAPNEVKRTVDPAISPDGSTVAFVWQGDIWTVPFAGGPATRLTVNEANEGFPIWTPDGQKIVFYSNRYGSFDIFSMDADGSDVKRLNFESSADYPNSVSKDGYIYGYTSAWGRLDLFRMPLTGGDMVRISDHPLEAEFYASASPDGSRIAFNAGGSPGHWRKPGQSGSNTSEVWTAKAGAPLTAFEQVTQNDKLDMNPVFISATEVVMMSNRDGAHNVYKLNVDTGRATKVTNFTGGTIRSISASGTTGKAVFQRNSEIYSLNIATGKSQPIAISAPSDSRRIAVQEIASSNGAQKLAISPNGKLMMIQVRGEIFYLPATGGTTRQLTTNIRPDSDPQWIDDETAIYVSAREKSKRSLHKLKTDGTNSLFYSHATLDTFAPVLSPDRKWILFTHGDRELMVMPAGGGTPVKVFEGDFSAVAAGQTAYSWAADSTHIAVMRSETRSTGLYIVKRDGTDSTLIARAGKGASQPVISPDMKHFAYMAVEGNDYSEIRNSSTFLYVVDLVPQSVTYSEDDLDSMGNPPAAERPAELKIERNGLDLRRRKTRFEPLWFWAGTRGSEVYANVDDAFVTINLATGSMRPVAGVTGLVGDVVVSGGRTYINQLGRLSVLNPAGAAPINYNAVMRVNIAQEEAALFEEAWWALDRHFYDPKMHGKDWEGIRKEFAAIVPYSTSRQDFYDLLGEMVERLDSSHQGATSSETFRPTVTETTAIFGVEWDWAAVDQGRFIVDRVYPGTPADHPDSRLIKGDQIISVNGKAIGKNQGLMELMNGQSGKKVSLVVRRNSEDVAVTIKPIPAQSISPITYRTWVNDNKAIVDKLSEGRLGYIHVQGMDEPSLDTFLREISTDLEGKEGVIVDVRYNGGGYTAHIILNIMRKEPWLIRSNRDLPGIKFSENLFRGNAVELPAACLTNEYSFSNAEIFSEGFQRMKLGPVIGEPTGGGVIGTSAWALWDGGGIRMPASGAHAINGENLEANGRKPNIDVPWDVNAYRAGRDTQLERGVAELMKRLGPG